MTLRLKSLVALAFGLTVLTPDGRADRPVGPPRKHAVQSPDGGFEAVTDPATQTTTVFQVGRDGRKEPLWAMVGWFRVMHLAADGQHLVLGHDGANLLPRDVKGDEILLRFVRRGELLRTVTLEELVPDRADLERTVSHLLWRHAAGWDEDGSFTLDTVDGVHHAFDVGTGRERDAVRRSPHPAGSTATLTIETRHAPGDSYWTVIWECGDTRVPSQLYHAYNVPTGHSVYRGDFNAVLQAVTDQVPGAACRDVSELLRAIEAAGWLLESESEMPASGTARTVVRTYRLP